MWCPLISSWSSPIGSEPYPSSYFSILRHLQYYHLSIFNPSFEAQPSEAEPPPASLTSSTMHFETHSTILDIPFQLTLLSIIWQSSSCPFHRTQANYRSASSDRSPIQNMPGMDLHFCWSWNAVWVFWIFRIGAFEVLRFWWDGSICWNAWTGIIFIIVWML